MIDKVGQASKKPLRKYRSVFLLNGLILLLLLGITIYIKLPGTYFGLNYYKRLEVLESLFREPLLMHQPYIGLLTRISEILWCLSAAICWFSFGLLQTISPKGRGNGFILYSGILLGILLADDMFRLTLLLNLLAGIPKIVMYLIYGIAGVTYSIVFWRRIRSTPYILLMITGVLLAMSGMADFLHLKGRGTPVMLEDGTKLLAILNVLLYFWLVCRREILRSLKHSNP